MVEKHQHHPTKTGKISQILKQARESLKILRTLEKETLAKAKTLIRIPKATERNKLKNERILSSLKKVGVATRADLQELYDKVQKLENSIKPEGRSSLKSKPPG